MRGIRPLYAVILLSIVITGAVPATKIAPSSEIPERREFPVSQTISPCVDFFEYACSEVKSQFELPEDRSRHTFAFNDSAERLLKAKTNFLGDLKQRDDLSPRAQELSDYYQSCVNTKARANEEHQVVAETLDLLDGMTDRVGFQKWLMEQTLNGQDGFVDFGPSAGLLDPKKNDLFWAGDSGLMGLPNRDYYQKQEVVADYHQLMVDFFTAIGVDSPEQRADWVIDFEMGYAWSYPLPEEERELWSRPDYARPERLKLNYQALQLDLLFQKIPESISIRHFAPTHLTYLNSALELKSLEYLKSVYLFASMAGSLDEGYPEFSKKRLAFNAKHLGSPPKRSPLEERCTRSTMSAFAKEIDAELMDELFPDFSREKFVALLERVRASIVKGLQENKWLSDKGRQGAIAKVEHAMLQVVSPETEEEWDFNPQLDYQPEGYLKNQRLRAKALTAKSLEEFLLPERSKKKWSMSPLTVNAYYSPSDNKFVMPLGILQYPFYDPNLADHINLGAVGMVVGHELGHGIDDQGSKYDDQGYLRDWMPPEDRAEFSRRTQPLVEQFKAIGHNGKLTLGENIGDRVGLHFAYLAAFPEGQGSTTEKQEFFTQYARVWCGVIRPKERERLLKTDPHAAMEARVNEQVKHEKAFEEAFQCKQGDPMVLPEDKRVHIWW